MTVARVDRVSTLLLLACTESFLTPLSQEDFTIHSPQPDQVFELGQPVLLIGELEGQRPPRVLWELAGSDWEQRGNELDVLTLPAGDLTLVASVEVGGEVLRDTVAFRVGLPDTNEDTGHIWEPEDTGEPDDTSEPEDTGSPSDPDCWNEHFKPNADISDLKSGFSGGNARSTMNTLFERRWKAGAELIDAQSHDPYIDVFLETGSWGNFIDSLGTVVHETTHGWDYENSLGGANGYFRWFFMGSLKHKGPWYDGFARSNIRDRVQGSATSLYYLYLEGQQGTYGWVELLDEATCYVNSLGALAAVGQEMPWGTSAVDGAVSFLYYIALYIEEADQEQPGVYNKLARPQYQDLVRDLWLRTHFFLLEADTEPKLSVYGDDIKPLMYGKESVIEGFLGYGLDGHCLE
jgi:hypothetical protein